MKERCYNKNNASYKSYGFKGIIVCDRWLSGFNLFIEDMGPKPSPKHSLDRIDNNKGYSPENCRWATHKQQQRNRTNNRMLEYLGEKKCLAEWAESYSMHADTLWSRLKRGWSLEKSLTKPIIKKRVFKK